VTDGSVSSVQTDVTLTATGGTPYPGVLTVPDGAQGPLPALVMIYEVFGMTDEMRRVARDLAAEGYVVLIPDLFARSAPRALCVLRTMRTVARGEGAELDDIEAARQWLAARPEVDAGRIGAIGFCMGGSFALMMARTGLYKVSAPFYGTVPDLPRACPIVASYGGRDLATRGSAEKLTARLDELGEPHDVEVYPGAGHSFMTRTGGVMGRVGPYLPLRAEYHEPSAEDAFRRITAFFREHLAAS
jgi:carboxymethylenebutenolidase